MDSRFKVLRKSTLCAPTEHTSKDISGQRLSSGDWDETTGKTTAALLASTCSLGRAGAENGLHPLALQGFAPLTCCMLTGPNGREM